jgi:hypothetical protein
MPMIWRASASRFYSVEKHVACFPPTTQPVEDGEYFDSMTGAFGLPRVPRICRAEVQCVQPESLQSFMYESQRLTNRRMKGGLKVKLRYCPWRICSLRSVYNSWCNSTSSLNPTLLRHSWLRKAHVQRLAFNCFQT